MVAVICFLYDSENGRFVSFQLLTVETTEIETYKIAYNEEIFKKQDLKVYRITEIGWIRIAHL